MKLCRRLRTAGVLITAVVSAGSFFPSATAQSDSISHRRLELPTGGSSDVAKQMQLLKRLRWLMGEGQNTANSDADGLSDSQRDMLKEAIKRVQETGVLPDLTDFPPELISEVMSDAKSRQQVKDMLDQFSKTRRFPRSGTRRGNPLPGPPGSEGPRTSSQSRSSEAPQASENSETGTSRPRWDPSPAGRERRRREKAKEQANDSDDQSAIDDIWKRFQELKELQKRKASKRASENNGEPGSASSNQQRTERSATEAPETGNDWRADLENMLRGQQGLPDSRPRGRNDASDAPGVRSGETPRGNEIGRNPNGLPTDDPQVGTDPDSPATAPPAISDFLESLKNLPPPPKTPGEEAALKRAADRQAAAARTAKAEELRRQREQGKAQLQRSGLNNTLRKIARETSRQMRKEAADRDSLSNTNDGQISSGMKSAIIKTLDGVREDVVKMVKDGKFKTTKPKETGQSRTNSGGSRNGGSRSNTKSKSTKSSWTKSAADFISNIAKPPDTNTSSVSSNTSGLPDRPGDVGSSSVLPFVILALLAVLVAALAWKTGVIGHAPSTRLVVEPVSADDIHSKRDVIRAFHHFALQPTQNAEAWWTHQKVTQSVVQEQPELITSVEVLAELYECARYLPDDVDLNEDQLNAARAALRQCNS